MIATLERSRLEAHMAQLFETHRADLATGHPKVDRLREEAIRAFDRLGVPSRKDEEWKYTDPSVLLKRPYTLAPSGSPAPDVTPFLIPDLDASTAVFVNGTFRPELSDLDGLPEGVAVTSLRDAAQRYPELVERHYGSYADPDSEPFVALNTALSRDGLFVYVPTATVLERPIYALFLTDLDEPALVLPRTLVVAESGSEASVVEAQFSTGGAHLNIPVTELFAGSRAHLTHYRIQDEGPETAQIGMVRGYQEEATVLTSITSTFSGSTVRNNVHFHPDGEHCETHLGGLFVLDGDQHVDNHTFIDHAKPHCFSNELFKGILDDRASSAFSGMLLVRPHAQKTNALQENKTILLTDDASSYAKPQLEIYADDVRCTHGATTGEVDPEALFYLRARGIGEEQGRNMLLFAFVSDVARMIRLTPLREWVVAHLHRRLV